MDNLYSQAGKDKSCKDLLPWTQHIVNHFWHACNRHDNGEVKTYNWVHGMYIRRKHIMWRKIIIRLFKDNNDPLGSLVWLYTCFLGAFEYLNVQQLTKIYIQDCSPRSFFWTECRPVFFCNIYEGRHHLLVYTSTGTWTLISATQTVFRNITLVLN